MFPFQPLASTTESLVHLQNILATSSRALHSVSRKPRMFCVLCVSIPSRVQVLARVCTPGPFCVLTRQPSPPVPVPPLGEVRESAAAAEEQRAALLAEMARLEAQLAARRAEKAEARAPSLRAATPVE